MIKNRSKIISAVLLIAVMAISSCGPVQEIPELVEPVVGQQTFRPVERRDVGKIQALVGDVVAKEYCHFFDSNMMIDSIDVSIGQYVNEGDIICTADLESVQSQASSISLQIQKLDLNHSKDSEIAALRLENLEMAKNLTEYEKSLGNASEQDVKDAGNAIEVQKENDEYDKLLYEYTKKSLNADLQELNKIMADGALRAKKSGYVTYVKSMEDGKLALAYENVVIISDFDDKYIEIEDTTRTYQYGEYEVKEAYIGGKRIEIDEYDYSEQELAYALTDKIFPQQRFLPVDDSIELKLGDKIVLQFYRKDKKNVLTVGKDSSKVDDQGTFVYVKKEDGSLEKRYYEQGIGDNYCFEVVSGLNEGEMVLYEQESIPPTKYEEHTVEIGNYVTSAESPGAKITEKNSVMYTIDEPGEVKSINVSMGDEVHKGDVLAEIIIDAQKGNVVSLQNELKHINEEHQRSVDTFSKNYKDLCDAKGNMQNSRDALKANLDAIREKIASGNGTPSDYATQTQLESTINQLDVNIKTSENNLQIMDYYNQIEIAIYPLNVADAQNKINNQVKMNDGSGIKKIVAEADGTVKKVIISPGDKVGGMEEHNLIYAVNNLDDVAWIAFTKSDVDMSVGYEFTIKAKDVDYEGVCVGSRKSMKAYIFTENGKVYRTYNQGSAGKYISVRIEDEEYFGNYLNDFTTMIDINTLKGLVMIPGTALFKETLWNGTVYDYVWKMEDGVPVKTYVTTGTEFDIGNDSSVIILNGLNAGDVVIKE